MKTTMDLLARAMERKNAAAWAREFNITPEALYVARRKGRLSPVLAGNLALELGENATEWIAKAAVEASEETPQNEPLLARLKARWKS